MPYRYNPISRVLDQVDTAADSTLDLMTADGELFIGSTASPNVTVGTLTAPSAGITITNGSGSITFALSDDLASIEGLSGIGLLARTASDTYSERTITGTSNFIDVSDGSGVSANPTISVAGNFESTGMHGWNGAIIESPVVTVTSDGTTITFSVEQSGGGDLTLIFSDGYSSFDSTPAATISLTEGTDAVFKENYVYILQSTKQLAVSTTSFPSAEHIPLATVLCQTAATMQTKKPMKVHAWTDHVTKNTNQGHISDLNFWIRNQNATWGSGVVSTFSGDGTATIGLSTTTGTALQLHEHNFPAFSDPATIYVVNDPDTTYREITNIADLLKDSTGASLTDRSYALTFWACVSEDADDCKIFCNLPSGSEKPNKYDKVRQDKDKDQDFSIPTGFRGTGFLIYRLVLQNVSDTTWSLDTDGTGDDLRGQLPNVSAGSSSPVGPDIDWNEVTGTSQAMVVSNGYIANNASLVTLTLPTTTALGDTIHVIGKGAGKFKIAQNAGQTIHNAATSSTTGVGGSYTADSQYNSMTIRCITADSQYNSMTIRCITANTDFQAELEGTFTVV